MILSKLDGDARGGAALSVKGVVGKPIAFASTGERLADFDLFHPDRMADRILGMGDVLSLIEQAERTMDHDEVAKGAARLMQGQFTLDDFLSQLRQVKKMGSMGGLMKLMPGMSKEMRQAAGEIDDGEITRVEAIVCSMTPAERDEVDPHRRLPPQPHRPWVRDDDPGRQHPAQAVQRDAEDDEGDGLGQHAQHSGHGRPWPAWAWVAEPAGNWPPRRPEPAVPEPTSTCSPSSWATPPTRAQAVPGPPRPGRRPARGQRQQGDQKEEEGRPGHPAERPVGPASVRMDGQSPDDGGISSWQ